MLLTISYSNVYFIRIINQDFTANKTCPTNLKTGVFRIKTQALNNKRAEDCVQAAKLWSKRIIWRPSDSRLHSVRSSPWPLSLTRLCTLRVKRCRSKGTIAVFWLPSVPGQLELQEHLNLIGLCWFSSEAFFCNLPLHFPVTRKI